MDTKGISIALKLLVFMAILTIVFVVMNVTGANKPPNTQQGQLTPTVTVSTSSTPSLTPSVISSATDIDAMTKELDSSLAEVDSLDKDLTALDTSFSTTDIDVLVKDLNAIN